MEVGDGQLTVNGATYDLPLRVVVGIASDIEAFDVTCPLCDYVMRENPFVFHPHQVIRGRLDVECSGCNGVVFEYLGLDEDGRHEI